MAQYFILGNGGFANELFEQIFLQFSTTKEFGGFIVLKDDKALLISDEGVQPFFYPIDAKLILGTGNKKWRERFLLHFLEHYRETEEHFPNISVNSAHISKLGIMGIGNVFCAFSMTNGNAVVGNFNLFNIYSTTSHDTVVGDYNIFCPNSSTMGYVKMKDFNFLAAGVTLSPGITIGSHNTLSAGEYLFEDMANKQFFQSGMVTDKK